MMKERPEKGLGRGDERMWAVSMGCSALFSPLPTVTTFGCLVYADGGSSGSLGELSLLTLPQIPTLVLVVRKELMGRSVQPPK